MKSKTGKKTPFLQYQLWNEINSNFSNIDQINCVQKKTKIEEPWTVSKLTVKIKKALESVNFQSIWVKGEISNLSISSNGHAYFSIKDEKSKVQCVIFRSQLNKITFDIKYFQNGKEFEIQGNLSVYEKNGSYQIIVTSLRPQGIGNLEQQFQLLKTKLETEGLFDEIHKKPIPLYPQKIGIITSENGAAFQDMIKVSTISFPNIHIILYPTQVQGDRATKKIANMIKLANQEKKADVLIIGRGGGSLEDLWAFNEEEVARAIFASKIPIISSVGHEIDFSISDFTADFRAATPTAAMNYVLKHLCEIQEKIVYTQRLLLEKIDYFILKYKNQYNCIRSNELIFYLERLLQKKILEIDSLYSHLNNNIKEQLNQKKEIFLELNTKLNAISPLKVLSRGYSVVYNEKGNLLTDSKQSKIDEKINLRLAQGSLNAKITQIKI